MTDGSHSNQMASLRRDRLRSGASLYPPHIWRKDKSGRRRDCWIRGKWAVAPQGAIKSKSAGLKKELLKTNEGLQTLSFFDPSLPPSGLVGHPRTGVGLWKCGCDYPQLIFSSLLLSFFSLDSYIFLFLLLEQESVERVGSPQWLRWTSSVLCFWLMTPSCFRGHSWIKCLYLDHCKKFQHRNKTQAVWCGCVFNSLQVWR